MRVAMVSLALASLVLAGCSHNVHRATAEAAYYQAQAASAAERQPIVELFARPGEAIVLQGVERFAVYAHSDQGQAQIKQYQGGPTFAETFRGIVRDAGPLFLGYTGYRAIERVAGMAVQHAGGNTTVGGNLGDTWTDASRTRIDDRSQHAGRDLRVGDETHIDDRSLHAGGDLRIGDDTRIGRIGDDTHDRRLIVRDACVGDNCRNHSPGPIDDNSDNSNNPITNPPPPPPEPGDG